MFIAVKFADQPLGIRQTIVKEKIRNAQNLGLPHFGAEQPADIYYFSELTVNIFGIADVTRKPTKMIAYGYTEDQGGKGGNNVASLIMKGLADLGWRKQGCPGKRLSIIMDNCRGQNKNKYVLRLALLLAELKYFLTVELIFYIRDHTKNACDRLFNQLKKRWHKRQVFTMTQVCNLFFYLILIFQLLTYIFSYCCYSADGANIKRATTCDIRRSHFNGFL